jgi:hypothetical protein
MAQHHISFGLTGKEAQRDQIKKYKRIVVFRFGGPEEMQIIDDSSIYNHSKYCCHLIQ